MVLSLMAFDLAYIEKKFAELKRALDVGLREVRALRPVEPGAAPAGKPKKGGKAAKAPARPRARKPGRAVAVDPLAALEAAFEAHPHHEALLAAGRRRDQLLRSLIPLYVGRELQVSSGTTSRFWAKHGVTYAAPNVAKALRLHPGNTRRTPKGPRITPAGIKYVENAL